MQPFSEEFSLCSWIRKLRGGSNPTWFSYATSNSNHNEIFIDDDGRQNYIFNDITKNVQSQAGVAVGEWYHYCLCWSLASRTATIHHNGKQTGSFSTPSGRRLTAGGYLVLGQDQDSYGGSFDTSQAFGGELYKLNIFSTRLSSSEVSELYSTGRCSDIEKKHDETRKLKWEQILQQTRTGDVSEIVEICGLEKKLQFVEGELSKKSSTLDQTETKLDQTETKLNQTEAKLNQTESKLNQTESKLDQTETKLNQTESKLDQTETKLGEAGVNLETTISQLNQTERELEEIKNNLNETLADVAELEEELEEIKTSFSGYDCFRLTNASYWDVLYTESFFEKVLTEDMLEILYKSWEKLGKLKNNQTDFNHPKNFP